MTREDLIAQSVWDHVKLSLADRGWGPTRVRMLEAFPYALEGEFTQPIVSAGFDFDDTGELVELGSDLTERKYTVEFYVFGLNNDQARSISNAIKFAFPLASTIPLYDYGQAARPEVDTLQIGGASAERRGVVDPEPYQEFVWATTLKFSDYYFASQA